jgi:hypothetical protein
MPMPTTFLFGLGQSLVVTVDHLSDEDLERYYLGMVADDSTDSARIEEHLLWCQECLDRCIATELYIDQLRITLLRLND